MTTETLLSQPEFLKRKSLPGLTNATLLVTATMVLAFGLYMYNIDSIGDSNAYYTAAVKSMLESWSNFFFVAAEPGGSVTVDKPPLGLWIQAAFAYFLGVSGFSVSLPNILAGVFSIPLLYIMVKKYAGELAGLVAAFVMGFTPIFIATNRNNTMDGMLVFFLLLAAWAFIEATEKQSLKWLLLGGFIVGLGFNIKMMQAFLPLPAFYALYFLGSKETWLRKVLNLAIATLLLVIVSLSWAIAVDLTPADSRPYIGSSDNNTVMGLIFGHNGISRLENSGGPGGGGMPPSAPGVGSPTDSTTQPRQGPPQAALDACSNSSQGAACSFTQPNGNTINGSCITPPNLSTLACAPQGMNPQNNGQAFGGGPNDGNGQGGSQFSRETGEPGALRFFTQPLSKQMSWLLPFALISTLLAFFAGKIRLPLENPIHKALILWGGWLLTCVVFFSIVSGIFHAYYAIMLAPALGAMVGIGFALLWSWGQDKNWAGILLIAVAALTIGFQIFAMMQYGEASWGMLGVGILFIAGSLSMVVWKRAAYVTLLVSMLIIPLYWSMMTVSTEADQNLPTAYSGSSERNGADRARQPGDGNRSAVNAELLAYLQENTQDVEYMVAVASSMQGSPLVLASGRPVLFMGGFGGQDQVVDVEDLDEMIQNGELRYIISGGERSSRDEIAQWLKASCLIVPEFSRMESSNPANAGQGGLPRDQTMILYQCK
jgi:4-amino-4-deoxy-L-arabinose transferase-like glycosyltransferase